MYFSHDKILNGFEYQYTNFFMCRGEVMHLVCLLGTSCLAQGHEDFLMFSSKSCIV